MVTVFWLSAAVEKIWDFLVGMTVFLGTSLVITPPTVSIPRVRGFTSSRTISPRKIFQLKQKIFCGKRQKIFERVNLPVSCSPERTPACTAAP